MIAIAPISLRVAREFVTAHHRHHRAPQGGKFAVGLRDGAALVGVVIVGRPVARLSDDGWTAEVTRLCVLDGVSNGCSMLYSAARRAALAMGYQRVITYTLASESGVSLRASGWRNAGRAGGGPWDRESRPRYDDHPVEAKVRWEFP